MADLHQTAGCILEPSRWYVFTLQTGAQIVDQPRRGFRTARQAWEWLRWQEADLRAYTVAMGAQASSVPISSPADGVSGVTHGQQDKSQHQNDDADGE